MQKGFRHTQNTRNKLRKAAFKRIGTERDIPRLLALPKGKNHWHWSNNPNKLTIHKRIHRKFGKAADFLCINCGKKARDWSSENGKYSNHIKEYKPRCRSCHVKKDKNWIKK